MAGQTLTQALAERGLRHYALNQGIHCITDNGVAIFEGRADEVWAWLKTWQRREAEAVES